METQTEVETYCENCQKVVLEIDNLFETNNGTYICQDCHENANDRYEMLYGDR